MKIQKKEKYIEIKADFARGYIKGDTKRNGFAELYIPAIRDLLKEDNYGGVYCYWNWSFDDLKDMADAIYAFLQEIKHKNIKK